MKPLKKRSADQALLHHQQLDARVYAEDAIQKDRIARARKLLADVAILPGQIVELGCGTGDISGPFSETHQVYGFDCNEGAIQKAAERFPLGHWSKANIADMFVLPTDTLVLCEVLEHLENPMKLVEEWGPKAKAILISHPINGDLDHDLSGGDHQWSYDLDDFIRWFTVAGHVLTQVESFPMGGYQVAIGYGYRK